MPDFWTTSDTLLARWRTSITPSADVLRDGTEYRIARELHTPVTVLVRAITNLEYMTWRAIFAAEDEERATRS